MREKEERKKESGRECSVCVCVALSVCLCKERGIVCPTARKERKVKERKKEFMEFTDEESWARATPNRKIKGKEIT